MKKMSLVLFFIVGPALIVSLVFVFNFLRMPRVEVGFITLEGKIVNMDVAAKQITKDSYLQLIRVTSDWRFDIEARNGKIIYTSDLAKTNINVNWMGQGKFKFVAKVLAPWTGHGKFKFVAKGLAPGKYAIAAQLVQWTSNSRALLQEKGTNEVAVFTVPGPNDTILVWLNLGDLVIPVQ